MVSSSRCISGSSLGILVAYAWTSVTLQILSSLLRRKTVPYADSISDCACWNNESRPLHGARGLLLVYAGGSPRSRSTPIWPRIYSIAWQTLPRRTAAPSPYTLSSSLFYENTALTNRYAHMRNSLLLVVGPMKPNRHVQRSPPQQG